MVSGYVPEHLKAVFSAEQHPIVLTATSGHFRPETAVTSNRSNFSLAENL
ncbi:MAG: hypothetical protein ACI8SI_002252, partial [Congregibacter sp.]